MKKIVLSIPLISTIILCILLLYLLFEKDDLVVPINENLPNFIGKNLLDKNEIINQDYLFEKKVLINFFASWCEPCKIEHNILMQISNNHKNILLLGFNFKDKKKEAINFIEKNGNPFDKIGIDNDGKIAMDFGVYGLPETFIVDKNGKIIFKHVGPITNKIYNNEIKKLLIK